MNPQLVGLLCAGALILGIVLFVGVMIYRDAASKKQRKQSLEKVAREMGFEFFAHDDPDLRKSLSYFHLFEQGNRGRIENLMQGKSNDGEVLIFDYSYSTGREGSIRTAQTVVCFQLPQNCLHSFTLRPKSIFHKFGQLLGEQDISINNHPVFSKKYVLQSKDEGGVRALFTAEVLSWFEGAEGITVEARSGRLLYFREGTRRKPKRLPELLEEGTKVLNLLLPEAQPGA